MSKPTQSYFNAIFSVLFMNVYMFSSSNNINKKFYITLRIINVYYKYLIKFRIILNKI